MNTDPRHDKLMLPFLGQAVLLCFLSAVFTLAVGVVYGMLSSVFGPALERVSHGTWLQQYFQTWLGAAVVAAFLTTKLVALRWHRKALLSPFVQ